MNELTQTLHDVDLLEARLRRVLDPVDLTGGLPSRLSPPVGGEQGGAHVAAAVLIPILFGPPQPGPPPSPPRTAAGGDSPSASSRTAGGGEVGSLRPAASDPEAHVLLTLRSNTVEHHKGQISFPGGVFEDGDGGLLETALRETCEEVGLPREAARVLGGLPPYRTITGFVIAPFVARVPWGPFRASADEIAELIMVPLERLLDPRAHSSQRWEHEGREILVRFYDTGASPPVWGATAAILHAFLARLAG